VLIINDNGSADLLHYTFENTKQDDQGRGKANLYEVPDVGPLDITPNIIPGTPNTLYIRVGIRGSDGWVPEDFFVFGEDNGSPIPLALATNIARVLSTDKSDDQDDNARLSIPIPLVNPGNPTTVINQLLVLMLTSGDGTNSPVQLRLKGPGGILVDFDMPPPSPQDKQDHQDANQANFYYVDVEEDGTPFQKNTVSIPDAIQLRLQGSDSWLPERFFLFGLAKNREDPNGPPVAIVPLVHIPDWSATPLGPLVSGTPISLPLTP